MKITKETLSPKNCVSQSELPEVLRLGWISDWENPALVPIPYLSSLLIKSDTLDFHTTLSIAENWLLQIFLQAPHEKIDICIYDTRLDTQMHAFERLSTINSAKGIDNHINFIKEEDEFSKKLTFWYSDARERKSRLISSGSKTWFDLLRKETAPPIKIICLTDSESIDLTEKKYLLLTELMKAGPRFGFWIWMLGGLNKKFSQIEWKNERETEYFNTVTTSILQFKVSKNHESLPILSRDTAWWEMGDSSFKNEVACYSKFGEIVLEPMSDQLINEIIKKYEDDINKNQISTSTEIDYWVVPIGKYQGTEYTWRLGPKTGAYHALLASKSGGGKSSFMNMLITKTTEKYSDKEIKFFLIDLSESANFSIFKSRTHVAECYCSISDFEPVVKILDKLRDTMTERASLFKNIAAEGVVQSVPDYNNRAIEKKIPEINYIALIIDEAQKLFPKNDPSVKRKIVDRIDLIAREGRKYGVMMLLASQSFQGVDIPEAAKAQFGIRMTTGLLVDSKLDFSWMFGYNEDKIWNQVISMPKWHMLINNKSITPSPTHLVKIDYIANEAIYSASNKLKS